MRLRSALAAFTTSVLLGACAGTSIGLSATNSPSMPANAPPDGSPRSSVSIQAEVTPGAFLGLVLLGYLTAGVHDDYLHWRYGSVSREPPELGDGRAVAARDCSQPLGPLYANLRCK